MKKDILIHLNGTHYVDGEKGFTRLTTVGEIEYSDNGGVVLSYDESDDETGMGATRTDVHVAPDGLVMLSRSGDFASQMLLSPGMRNTCYYETPFGNIILGVFAETVDVKCGNDSGELRLNYTVDINNDIASKNEIFLKYKEA